MAAMSTPLTEFTSNGNSRTSTTTGHTAQKPKVVIERRIVAEGKKTLAEKSTKVLFATVDPEGVILREKIVFDVIHKMPVNGLAADQTAALAVFRDIVNSDEFAATIVTQNWLKP